MIAQTYDEGSLIFWIQFYYFSLSHNSTIMLMNMTIDFMKKNASFYKVHTSKEIEWFINMCVSCDASMIIKSIAKAQQHQHTHTCKKKIRVYKYKYSIYLKPMCNYNICTSYTTKIDKPIISYKNEWKIQEMQIQKIQELSNTFKKIIKWLLTLHFLYHYTIHLKQFQFHYIVDNMHLAWCTWHDSNIKEINNSINLESKSSHPSNIWNDNTYYEINSSHLTISIIHIIDIE